MGRERVLAVTLVAPTRADPEQGVEYSAHFRRMIGEGDPGLKEMASFALSVGARLELLPGGFPAFGMACTVALGILTEAEAAEFRRLFSPDMESAIPLL